jgi:Xaa-Pro aminopeptidase
MKYHHINSKLFTENRARFIEKMKPNSVAIFHAHPQLPENSDAIGYYKPNSDVVWLSGVVQEKTMVVLFPDHPDETLREVLVVIRPNEHLAKWEGHKLTKEQATKISGIKTVMYAEGFEATLHIMMHLAENVYVDTNENDRLDLSLPRIDLLFVHQLMRNYPVHNYLRAAVIMKELRAIKSKLEVDVLKQAVDITHSAFLRTMRFIRPGVFEHEIEAEIMHEFISLRATRQAYSSIIASGDRARVLHYVENNQECKDGELILMDFGAEYGNYCADLTRTIPVNGKFTKRQKEIYDACLAVHVYCAKILRAGKNYAEYMLDANAEMERQLLKIGLISEQDIKNQDPANPAFKKYFYHGIGHHLGIDVHDIGTRTAAVEDGMVFTIEPGIYVEEEQVGIRIENNYWLNKGKSTDLFKGIPITTEEIEAYMKANKRKRK